MGLLSIQTYHKVLHGPTRSSNCWQPDLKPPSTTLDMIGGNKFVGLNSHLSTVLV